MGGTWRCLWRAMDANGQCVDVRLTAGRDAKSATVFPHRAIEPLRLRATVTP
ncbi:DDE-type integrase/transposase/recombinase [Yoonia sp.]|uniref:DDE-type integrase/transposase/recombinase n=1 Tax=Yoonia sp. TaxID=2212373 RepID=UPI002FDB3AC6